MLAAFISCIVGAFVPWVVITTSDSDDETKLVVGPLGIQICNYGGECHKADVTRFFLDSLLKTFFSKFVFVLLTFCSKNKFETKFFSNLFLLIMQGQAIY